MLGSRVSVHYEYVGIMFLTVLEQRVGQQAVLCYSLRVTRPPPQGGQGRYR